MTEPLRLSVLPGTVVLTHAVPFASTSAWPDTPWLSRAHERNIPEEGTSGPRRVFPRAVISIRGLIWLYLMSNRVKALMVLKGIKQIDICRKLRVQPSTVSMVVSGKTKSARIRKAIADGLGMNVDELWPDKGHTA